MFFLTQGVYQLFLLDPQSGVLLHESASLLSTVGDTPRPPSPPPPPQLLSIINILFNIIIFLLIIHYHHHHHQHLTIHNARCWVIQASLVNCRHHHHCHQHQHHCILYNNTFCSSCFSWRKECTSSSCWALSLAYCCMNRPLSSLLLGTPPSTASRNMASSWFSMLSKWLGSLTTGSLTSVGSFNNVRVNERFLTPLNKATKYKWCLHRPSKVPSRCWEFQQCKSILTPLNKATKYKWCLQGLRMSHQDVGTFHNQGC